MCLNGSHSGRFGQSCLFEEDDLYRNEKITDPTGQNIYRVEMNF
jgi:hypothetical protein